MTQLTSASSRMRLCRAPSTRSKALSPVRSSSAPSPRCRLHRHPLRWTVVPTALLDGKLNKMWLRRQTTKFNGVPYIVQKGAAACFTEEGMKQIKETLGYYKQNAKVLAATLDELGIWYTGGKSSPYLWLKCPNGMDSWTFFDYLLENANVVGTPGAGFGKNGDGFFRLTAFGDQARTKEAAERLKKLLKK